MRHRLLLPLLAAAALAGPAGAQSFSDPGVGLGAHLCLSRGVDTEAPSLSGGVQVRARVTGGIALEALVAWRTERFEEAGARVLTLDEVPVQISGLLFPFFRSRVQPYVVGGVGYYWVRATGEGANAGAGRHTENKFGFHAGAGLEARLAPRVTALADLRYVFLEVDALRNLGTLYPPGKSGDFWQGTAGLSYSF